MRSVMTNDMRSHFYEPICSFVNGYKLTVLKKKVPTKKQDFPPFCITLTNERDTTGNYINEKIFSWYTAAKDVIERYEELYEKLSTKK